MLPAPSRGPHPAVVRATADEKVVSTQEANLLQEHTMDDAPTCGEGLAANSALPATLADVISALSTVLAAHLTTLDLRDENSREEHAVYSQLTRAYDDIAGSLRAAAERMRSCRDLPMGRHNMQAMTASKPAEAFAFFVNAEQELLALLEARLPGDRAMLAAME
jgi:hypothetical protein